MLAEGKAMMLRRLFLIAFLNFPCLGSATVYLEEPKDFNPKIEVVGCFLTYDDQILLLHRQNNKLQGNTWGIPGGKLEKGESPIDGAMREVCEETQFKLPQNKIEYLGKVFIKHPTADFVYHMVRGTTICEKPGDVKIRFEEHKGFTWVTPVDALKMRLMEDEDTCIKLIYNLGIIKEQSPEGLKVF